MVTIFPDSGTKYLSKMYNDDWMLDQGFLARQSFGDLRDLIVHRHLDHTTIFATPDETLLTVLKRMKDHDISQLPVLEEDRIVGLIDESDFLFEVYHDRDHFQEPVKAAMTTKLEVIDYRAPIRELIPIFRGDHVAIVMEGEKFLGIITRIDLINHLHKTL